jgi:hypothetical protein
MANALPAEARSRVENARALAARLPDLLVAARRIAANVLLGPRRAGAADRLAPVGAGRPSPFRART